MVTLTTLIVAALALALWFYAPMLRVARAERARAFKVRSQRWFRQAVTADILDSLRLEGIAAPKPSASTPLLSPAPAPKLLNPAAAPDERARWRAYFAGNFKPGRKPDPVIETAPPPATDYTGRTYTEKELAAIRAQGKGIVTLDYGITTWSHGGGEAGKIHEAEDLARRAREARQREVYRQRFQLYKSYGWPDREAWIQANQDAEQTR
jgi:hypothetical protein